MTNLEKNVYVLRELAQEYPEKFEQVVFNNGKIFYGGKSFSIENIDIEVILENSNLKNDFNGMSVEQFLDVLRISSTVLQSAMRSDSFDVKLHNLEVSGQMKDQNNAFKNIAVFNKKKDMIEEQYVTVVDLNGVTHVFKNDRNYDLSRAYQEFITNGNNANINYFISSLQRTLPEISMTSSINLDNNSEVSEDFSNKLKEIQKEFEGQMGISVSGNESEDMIIIQDINNPERTQIRTYSRDENNNLVVEKHVLKDDYNDKKTNEDKKDEQVQEYDTQLDEIKLIPYEDFIYYINSEKSLSESEQKEVNLWYQTLGDIFIYEKYLPGEVLKYYEYYCDQMQKIAIAAENGQTNENQNNALKKYYELTDEATRSAKLDNINDERKNAMVRVLRKNVPNDMLPKTGKISIAIMIAILAATSISIICLIYTIFKLQR